MREHQRATIHAEGVEVRRPEATHYSSGWVAYAADGGFWVPDEWVTLEPRRPEGVEWIGLRVTDANSAFHTVTSAPTSGFGSVMTVRGMFLDSDKLTPLTDDDGNWVYDPDFGPVRRVEQ